MQYAQSKSFNLNDQFLWFGVRLDDDEKLKLFHDSTYFCYYL